MSRKKYMTIILPALALGVILFFTGTASPSKTAQAACGASLSSCKTCHEIKAEYHADITKKWHLQHSAFDSCQACHLGRSRVIQKDQAHQGMLVNPLSEPDQTCAECHKEKTVAFVEKYVAEGASGPEDDKWKERLSDNSTNGSDEKQAQQSDNVAKPADELQIPWSTIIISTVDLFAFLILLTLAWRWKKGFWPWSGFHPDRKAAHLPELPPEEELDMEREREPHKPKTDKQS